MQRRTGRDQGRRAVADRRAVGDVAADRAGIADLHRGEAPPHLAHVRVPAGQRRHGIAVADSRADRDPVVGLLDLLQLAHAAEIDHGVEHALLLGDPQADIGAAGDDRGLGLLQQHLRQRLDGGGRDEPPPAVAHDQRLLVGQRVQPRHGLAGEGLDRIGPGLMSVGLLHGPHDRRVAGAAAEIAGQRVVDGRLVRQGFRLPGQGEHRHHETRRAEAALRAVAVDHRLLHRMQLAVGRFQILDRQQLAAVQGAPRTGCRR